MDGNVLQESELERISFGRSVSAAPLASIAASTINDRAASRSSDSKAVSNGGLNAQCSAGSPSDLTKWSNRQSPGSPTTSPRADATGAHRTSKPQRCSRKKNAN